MKLHNCSKASKYVSKLFLVKDALVRELLIIKFLNLFSLCGSPYSMRSGSSLSFCSSCNISFLVSLTMNPNRFSKRKILCSTTLH